MLDFQMGVVLDQKKSFIEILSSLVQEQNWFSVSITSNWTQGRTSFGGLTAALGFQAARGRVDLDRPARTINVSFIAPLEPGLIRLETEILRDGRTVSFVESRLIQNDRLCVKVLTMFAQARSSQLNFDAQKVTPPHPPPDANFKTPFVPELKMPAFLGEVGMYWVSDNPPFGGKGGREISGWVRHYCDPYGYDEAYFLAMCDIWPTPALSSFNFGDVVRASSVSWSLEFIDAGKFKATNGWYYFKCIIDSGSDGYCQHEARLFDLHGAPVMVSRQAVAVFAES